MSWYVYRYKLTNFGANERTLVGSLEWMKEAEDLLESAMAREKVDPAKCYRYDLPSGRPGFAVTTDREEDLIASERRTLVVFAVQADEEEEESL